MSNPSSAERKAMELLERFEVSQAPVPVEEMAQSLGAQITYEPYEGEISGMLLRDGKAAVIGVNSRHAATRQRFTVAHEIGHLAMHRGQPVFIDRFMRVSLRDGKSNREETQANAFAAELLMPRRLIHGVLEHVLSRGTELAPQDLVEVLAKRFAVSTEAMQYRLINLGILDPYSLAG